jgi:hypothetical protein
MKTLPVRPQRLRRACALLLLALAPMAASALPGFRALPARSVEAANYEQARGLALDLLGRAAPDLAPPEARLARAAASALARARFLASSDRDSFRTCASGSYSLFVTPREPGRIFVCDDVRPHARAGGAEAVAILAQGFVHESAHLVGVRDECAATRFELDVMDRTIGRRSTGSRIRYGARCAR